MGFDLGSIFRDPPPYLFVLLGIAAVAVGAMLVRLLRRHRHGAERVEVRLSDW